MDRRTNYTIMETNNFDKFKKLLGNRDITPSRVSSIKESILRIGYQPVPALVNEKYEIVDGQGRIEACKALNIPTLYIMKKGLTIDDCISMNIKMKNWSEIDYLKSYAARGFFPYVEMMKMLDAYPELNWVELMICEGYYGSQVISDEMKNGKLKFRAFNYTEHERARWISAIAPVIKKSPLVTRRTIETLLRLDRYKLIDKKRMSESIDNYAEGLKKGSLRADDTLNILNELYNYNRRSKKYFADDYKRLAAAAHSRKNKEVE